METDFFLFNYTFPLHQILFACLLAVAVARPDSGYSVPSSRSDADEIAILRDDRVYPSAVGEFSSDTETEDGIEITQSGYDSDTYGAVEKQGTVKFTLLQRALPLTFVSFPSNN